MKHKLKRINWLAFFAGLCIAIGAGTIASKVTGLPIVAAIAIAIATMMLIGLSDKWPR